jgi:hypothetical protein
VIQDDSHLKELRAALDRAQIPHVVGLHYRYKTPTGKPREAEQWIMVPFQNYGAARSLFFSLPGNTKAPGDEGSALQRSSD